MILRHAETKAAGESRIRSVVNFLLFLAGIGLFVYLVYATGVTFEMLADLGLLGFGLLFFIAGLVIFLDTIAWYHAIRHVAKPGIVRLLGLRIAGDSLTNGMPGGVVLGETYKAVMLRRFYGVSLSENAASLLMVKFGLGVSQAIFVLLGLALSYPLLRDRSMELFGFEGAQYIGLALTIGMGLFMLFPLTLMFRGNSFKAAASALGRLPIPSFRRWLERREEKIAVLDKACATVLRNNRRNLALTFFFLLAGWIVSSLESYVLLCFMGLSPTISTAFVIESVGSMFRLIFFLVPSGIGGQDASFLALFKLYGLPTAAGGVFVLFKRFKEVLWIGIGFCLILIFRRSSPREGKVTSPCQEPRD